MRHMRIIRSSEGGIEISKMKSKIAPGPITFVTVANCSEIAGIGRALR